MTAPRIKDQPMPAELFHPDRACRNEPDRIFPRDGERREEFMPRMQKAAEELCQDCPILAVCRDAGYTLSETGLWGGVLHIRHATSGKKQSYPLIVGWRPTP
jgi:hypothetical protein